MSHAHRAEQAQDPSMSDPRGQRAVAAPDSSSSGPRGGATQQGFAPDDLFITFAYATLAREIEALLAARPQEGRTPTPEEIHQLRVAARRLRVALRLFRRMLPSRDVARFRADLRWFASSLGDARDLDVYSEDFKTYRLGLPAEPASELRGYELDLRRERADARQRATATFVDPRTTALFDDIAKFPAAGPTAAAIRRWRSLTVRDGVRNSIRESVRRVRRLGNRLGARSRPAEIHELRIKTKRLRYELEFFTKAYPMLDLPAKTCK